MTTLRQFIRRWFAVILLLAAASAAAQSGPAEHVFQVPQAEVDRALHDLKTTSPGKLPTLDGFVTSDIPMLDKYRRPYYQYKVETHPAGNGATLVRVSAKVTAWYAGATGQAGYRELPSNGRLEEDLIERLEDELQPAGAAATGKGKPDSTASANVNMPPDNGVQHAPASVSSPFRSSLPLEPPIARSSTAAPTTQELQDEKRLQRLSEQAMNLEDILHNQSRPTDLAAVRKTGTPVYAKADATAEVLFQSDAEDEFKVLDESGDWVHVQVSGPARGWIRRSDLEMPGEMSAAGRSDDSAVSSKQKEEAREDTSLFPGDWPPLRGRMVRIRWVQPEASGAGSADRWQLARSVFRDAYSHVLRSATKVDGVVIVIDSADGGMIAATTSTLQRWNSGAISDAAFRKECWADPPETLRETAKREDGAKSNNP